MGQQSSEPDLFDVKRKPVRQPKAPATPPEVLHRLFAVYRDGYERRFHEPPVILKSDGPILTSLIKQFGAQKVEQRLRAFLEWTDPFIVDSGFALTVFKTNWNRLAARCVQQQSTPTHDVDRTSQYLQQLRAVR